MDGLDVIHRGHGRPYAGGRDAFYLSAVDNSLAFFDARGVRATYFVIARDLEDPHKRPAIERVVAAGHHVASHTVDHKYLYRISSAEKRVEIFDSKARIEQTLGVECQGFRAPGYSIDLESLQLLREAGYRYDSSIIPGFAFRQRLGVERLFRDPFLFFPDDGFAELPMPHVGPWLPPFHPSYALYFGAGYFRRRLRTFQRHSNYLTLLFHLTDFAERQPGIEGVRLNAFTLNYYSRDRKLRVLNAIADEVQRQYRSTTSEAFVREWPHSAPGLTPRVILGISTTHETGACVVRDGEVVSAVGEERLSRVKLDTTYPPKGAIREAIRLAGVAPSEIDAVAIAGLHWTDLLPQTLESIRRDARDYHALNDYLPHLLRLLYRLFYLWRATRYSTVRTFLEREYGISPKLWYVEHHEAHASSAHRTGEAKRTLIVTADGVGDDVCLTISRGDGTLIRRLETLYYPHSFGQFYTACTQILGFKGGRHEGKITGLAGYGRPNPELQRRVEGTIFPDPDGFRLNKKFYAEGFVRLKWRDLLNLRRGRRAILSIDYRNYKPPLKRLLRGFPREDVAYAFQHILEREVVRLTRRHVGDRPLHLVLAGGVFANVKLNMALSQELRPESIYIYPNMGDGGLCVGAALSVSGRAPERARDMYLGTEYSEGEIVAALDRYPELARERPDDMARSVANALAQHRIVARFAGRMEFGPRALGNRSILYHAGDRTVNAWLNAQLKRTEFMPFAPMCIYEDAEDYFVVRDGELRPCEFMTLVVACTEKMATRCPAAVHVDGTARPQLVRHDISAQMYEILLAYRELTGLSCIINTSFNMHEEPIIRSPDEAIRSFLQSNLDILALGPFLVSARAAMLREAMAGAGTLPRSEPRELSRLP